MLTWPVPAPAGGAQTSPHVKEQDPASGVQRSPTFDSLGVMYSKPSGEVWMRVLALFREVGLAIEDKDETGGVVISDWYLFPGNRSSGLLSPPVRKGYRPERFKLHVFVSPSAGPARVYVGSVTQARQLARSLTAEFYNARTPERWFLESLGRKLGERGEWIPDDGGERRRLALKLRPDLEQDPCMRSPDESGPSAPAKENGEVQAPVLVPVSKVEPAYPYHKARRGEGTQLVFQAVIREDGFIEQIKLLSPARAEEEFLVAARGALSFWRYRPAMRDGCPVSVYLAIRVDFHGRR